MMHFGEEVFGAIILVLCAGISSHLCFGYSSKRSRDTFVGLILLIMMGYQYYQLILAALYIPASRFSIFNPNFHRSDCLESTKGGKRPFKETQVIDLNPCFCLSPDICASKRTGVQITLSSGQSCPLDGTATCRSNGGLYNGTQIKPYISHFRNCIGGQGVSCTKDQPCFPCERETLKDWSYGVDQGFGIGRCRTCATDYPGNCDFILDVGPYCYDKKGSKKVVPCKRCCTEPLPLIINGTCY